MAARDSRTGQRKFDLQIKLMMIGDQNVGKTALLMRYAENEFHESLLPTIGIDFKIKTVELLGKLVKLQIWDTAGQERFRTITQAYYRGAMGILLIYDVTTTKSWSNVRNWVRNIQDNAPQTVNKILIGNKCDLASKREVTTQQGEQLAREYGMKFLETSARENLNVQEAFFTLASDVVERLVAGGAGSEPPPSEASGVNVKRDAAGSKNFGCC
uniref:Uncharacterized protein n=1 Tax=Haptolina brevifila TaxID=156173 RepID=A0A7S2CX30_9EUKA|eukprot:CAMPEP_0174720744 /NCGR_PEP_ID=MMETSP1094-20130205/34347_1 /TAXON_ID=156173 /ORGANISM="Chrysochromulina brevifilum, Strain UTEX LB 985" /LENGTH=213 /DNA_ID=CAMNT_0015921277 /DNA_START=97 /DNA_END=738 /DNA_ORIENTATION=-